MSISKSKHNYDNRFPAVSTRVTMDEHAALSALAKAHGTTLGGLLRHYIREKLGSSPKTKVDRATDRAA